VPDVSNWWPLIVAFASAFGLLVIAGFGLPIPEEGPVIAAGIWVANNPEFGPVRWLILPVCLVAISISDVILYGMGRWWGASLLKRRWMSRLLPPERREHIERNFHRYGLRILLLVRWVPGIRSPMFITAGIMRLPLYQFVIADGIAIAVGHTVIFGLAFWFGDQFGDLVKNVENTFDSMLRPILILALILAIAGYLLLHFWRRPVTEGDPQDVPLIGGPVGKMIEGAEKHLAEEPPLTPPTPPASVNGEVPTPQPESEPRITAIPPP
jgi:membrane protein DedA with SNARE-associated domain